MIMFASDAVSTGELILYLLPVIIIQLALMVYALVDLLRREKVRTGSKALWAAVILLFNLVGPIVYLAWGRHPSAEESDAGPGPS